MKFSKYGEDGRRRFIIIPEEMKERAGRSVICKYYG